MIALPYVLQIIAFSYFCTSSPEAILFFYQLNDVVVRRFHSKHDMMSPGPYLGPSLYLGPGFYQYNLPWPPACIRDPATIRGFTVFGSVVSVVTSQTGTYHQRYQAKPFVLAMTAQNKHQQLAVLLNMLIAYKTGTFQNTWQNIKNKIKTTAKLRTGDVMRSVTSVPVSLKIEIHEIHEIHQNLRNPMCIINKNPPSATKSTCMKR